MRAAICASLAVLVATVAGGSAAGNAHAPKPKLKTGLHGLVTRELNLPKCGVDLPCKGSAPGIRLTFFRNKEVAGTTTTRKNGTYRIRLAPGSYNIQVDQIDRLVRPGFVTVPPHGFLRVNVFLEIGATTNADSPKPKLRTGLHGLVTRGPLAPVCTVELACYGPAADLGLVFTRDGAVAGMATTDANGVYSIRLPPGTYSVQVRGARRMSPVPSTATVPLHGFGSRNFFVDTGIR